MKQLYNILFITLFITSCNTLDVYEKTKGFPDQVWKSTDTPSFSFEVKDAKSLYNIQIVLRHTDAYHFKNIWANVLVQGPDSSFSFKRDFVLADNQHWLGSSMDDIIEHRIPFNPFPIPLKKGKYTFTLQHIMREEPLQNVLHAGIRVEKAK